MRDCWQHEPADRPSFELIRQTLDEMLSRGDDPYFDPIGEHEGVVDDVSRTTQPIDGKHCYTCNVNDMIFQQTIMESLLFTEVVG